MALFSDIVGEKSIRVVSFYDQGGQNKIFKGKMTIEGTFISKSDDVILKTAQIDKNKRFQDYLESENQILQKLSSVKGIVKSLGIHQVQNQLNNNKIEQHMVLEYCQYGSLHNLAVFTKPFDEPTAFVVFNQITKALEQVHSHKILHLDLKESNILITFSKENQHDPLCGNIPLEFKLADWGVSRNLNILTKKELAVYHRGTPRYMAPEQQHQKQVEDPYKVEVFSLGIILFRMIFKTFPFSCDQAQADLEMQNPSHIQNFVRSQKNTSKVVPSDELVALLTKMFQPINQKRYSVRQVLDDEWCKLQSEKLLQQPEVADKTYKSMFQKLQYIVNLTKVKIDLRLLKQKREEQALIKSQSLVGLPKIVNLPEQPLVMGPQNNNQLIKNIYFAPSPFMKCSSPKLDAFAKSPALNCQIYSYHNQQRNISADQNRLNLDCYILENQNQYNQQQIKGMDIIQNYKDQLPPINNDKISSIEWQGNNQWNNFNSSQEELNKVTNKQINIKNTLGNSGSNGFCYQENSQYHQRKIVQIQNDKMMFQFNDDDQKQSIE